MVMYYMKYYIAKIVDPLVNADGQSVSDIINLNVNALNYQTGSILPSVVNNVYPNSLENMRNELVSNIGQVLNVLPTWMISEQEDGNILGFTPSWVIAYAKPGQSAFLKYNITTLFSGQLNELNFVLDRFVLNSRLTKDWNVTANSWNDGVLTTFDRIAYDINVSCDSISTTADSSQYMLHSEGLLLDSSLVAQKQLSQYDIVQETLFDGGSCVFTAPVTQFTDTNYNDTYIVFPQTNIIDNAPIETI